MNIEDSQLKLQAYLDGELSAGEAAQVKASLAGDPAAEALLAELRSTKSVLAGNEPERKLPASREFFWSQIQREIERQGAAAAPAAKQSWFAWLQQHLLPVTGAAFLACALGIMVFRPSASNAQFGEMEMASDDMGAYTYRDQQAQMTTIWFYNRSDSSQFTDAALADSVDTE